MSIKTIHYPALFIVVIALMLSACNTIQRLQTNELTTTFNERFRLYSKHLRWGHFNEVTTFMTQEHIAPSIAKINSFKERRITSIKPLTWILDEQAGTMVGDIDVDYYIADRGVIRSTSQHQTWRLNGEIWQLDAGLPDLR